MWISIRKVARAAALLALACAAGCSKKQPPVPTAPKAARPTDVILITLDTTRRDHLGAYGYGPPVSTHIDSFAKAADLYTKAYASSSWTVPTHASILTGLYASDHGAHGSSKDGIVQLEPEVPTLAEALRERGYATGAVLGAHTLNQKFGLSRGFDLYEAPAGDTLLASRRADVITQRALQWVDEQGERPLFLFVNYFDAHIPYRPSGSCRDRFAKGVSPHVGNSNQWLKRPLDENLRLYDAEICYMDEQLGLLLDGLKKRDRFDDALVVIAADHGESFDAGKGPHHGDTLDEALIHVPLFVKHPKQTQGARVEELFETRRLFFTMRDATADPPAKAPAPQDESHAQAFAVSELWRGKPDDLNPVLRALIRWPLKLLKPPGDGTEP
ncbi:MAG: sulfatase, partial [Myxococcales bacterium]